jgi:hypothetical protein
VSDIPAGWIEASRQSCTHLYRADMGLVPRKECVMDEPYGHGSGFDQDLVDRGHRGWVRVRKLKRWEPAASAVPERGEATKT